MALGRARIRDKVMARKGVIRDTVVRKYLDHLPLYRQSAILEREAGIEMPRATLTGWFNRVGELLRPISASRGQELLAGDYIQAAETPVRGRLHDAKAQNPHALLSHYPTP